MKRRIIRYLVCMLACLGMLFVVSGAETAWADGLEVHFLNVGRNDGILIRCGGEDVFIDSGMYRYGIVSRDYMKQIGVNQLKYYVGTHGHRDHVGGAAPILAAFDTGAVLVPHARVRDGIEACASNEAERQAVEEAKYVTMQAGQKVTVGDAVITCLGPLSIRNVSFQANAENENSLVLMLTYGDVDILLSADATAASLRAIEAANPGALNADVYKNAHHNGRTRSDIIQAISPQWTIFSTSSSDQPDRSYVNELMKAGSQVVLTTEKHGGNVVLTTDGSAINIQTQYKPESITLNNTSLELFEGKTGKLKATVRPSRYYNRAIFFSSDNPSIASVNEEGKITAVSAGQTVIRAKDASGMEATCTVTVKPATMKLRKTEYSVKQHSRVSASWKIEPSGSKPVIRWESKDPSIATVDEKGRITGVYPGVTTITATMPGGQVSSLKITVNPIKVSSVSIKPSSVKMTIGETMTVTTKISPKNATWPGVTWSSADESILTIDQNGVARAVGVGKTTITATTKEGKSRTAKVTVKPVYVKKIYLKADVTEGLIGGVAGRNQVKLSYSVEPSNATIKDVVWTSSNKKTATVDENGVVTGHRDGSVTITAKATDGSGRSARFKLKFGKNELNRNVVAEKGQMAVQVSRIRYSSNQLEVRMTYANRTGDKVQIPYAGMLTLVTPDGKQIPLLPVNDRPTTLRNKSSKTYKYKIPLSANPRLNGLDLSRCDVIIVSPGKK